MRFFLKIGWLRSDGLCELVGCTFSLWVVGLVVFVCLVLMYFGLWYLLVFCAL